MMIGFLGWVARRRAGVLAMALVTAVVLQFLGRVFGNDGSLQLDLAVSAVPFIVFVVCAAVAARGFHPAKLVVRPEVPAFDVPVDPSAVLGAAGYTFFATSAVGNAIHDLRKGEDLWFSTIFIVIVAGLLGAQWRLALGRTGVRLSPDGITDRQAFGSLHVPWDALATPRAALPRDTQRVTLYLALPELVQRRGLRFGGPASLPAAGVNAELLARAIHEYANHADLRPTVGSPAALARFQAIPQVRDLANRV